MLDDAVVSVLGEITWEQRGFALADGYDDGSDTYVGLRIPHQDQASVTIGA